VAKPTLERAHVHTRPGHDPRWTEPKGTSGCAAFVAMVQSANLSDCHYASQFPPLNRLRLRRVLPNERCGLVS